MLVDFNSRLVGVDSDFFFACQLSFSSSVFISTSAAIILSKCAYGIHMQMNVPHLSIMTAVSYLLQEACLLWKRGMAAESDRGVDLQIAGHPIQMFKLAGH